MVEPTDGIFLSQDKYVGDILKKFRYSDVRSSNTPMDKENPWGKDRTGKDVDLHLYRSMIGSLMYLTASRPDIMFAVYACARHQVTPKECHLDTVKRIFRYLKGHPKLGLWYLKESPFDLVAYSDSDYGGATQDRKSTTIGCQFFGRRLILWQCKKQTIMATSTTEAEYVAAASCFGQVLWIQNQLLDYGHHFIRDCFEKKLINVDHIHTDENVADLLIKPFDAGRFQYLVCKLFSLLGKLSTVSVFLGFRLTFAGTSKYWGVLRILMISLRLIPLVLVVNMCINSLHGSNSKQRTHEFIHIYLASASVYVWISEHNVDFHPVVDFVEASPLRIETTEEGTKILATVDVILRTITESSLRRNLKLQDKEGISSLPDSELFENLTLMGYNISPNQKFTFQKGHFSHQWNLQRKHSEMIAKFEAHEVEINRLKARVKLLKDREGVAAERSKDDAPIKGRNLDEGEAAAERVSDDTEEMATVLTSMDAATVLAARVADVPTGSGSIPTVVLPAAEVPTGSDVVPTASPVFATATVVTPYRRRKGKEVMVESESPKKQKVQEQIDAQVARELEEQLEREDQRMSKQIARDAEIARIHAEKELQIVIDTLDKSNETVAKYLQEYQQFASELPLERRIELISDLIKYQDNYAKIYKYQKRFKRKGTRFEQESTKKLKTSEEVPEEVKSPDEVLEEKHLDREDLNQLWRIVKESLSNRPPTSDKEMELWKLYDSCGVHHVTARDKEIFMLVEKDYPLRKGASSLGGIVRNKMHTAFPLPVIEFPLAEEVPTASEESCHCQKKREATAKRIALLGKCPMITPRF
nr:putative ribonuclease H-like domain-containing protein [Tanacetum cinerariifolium]